MSNEKASKSQEPSDPTDRSEELNDDELAKVAGGVAIGLQPPPIGDQPPPTGDKIVSPRDPASGLPTGQRMHKPVVIG